MIWLVSRALLVQSPGWRSELRIWHCGSCGIGCRCGLDPILAQELPYAVGVATKVKQKKKKKKKKKKVFTLEKSFNQFLKQSGYEYMQETDIILSAITNLFCCFFFKNCSWYSPYNQVEYLPDIWKNQQLEQFSVHLPPRIVQTSAFQEPSKYPDAEKKLLY